MNLKGYRIVCFSVSYENGPILTIRPSGVVYLTTQLISIAGTEKTEGYIAPVLFMKPYIIRSASYGRLSEIGSCQLLPKKSSETYFNQLAAALSL